MLVDAQTPEEAATSITKKYGYHPIHIEPANLSVGIGNENIRTKSLLSFYQSMQMLAPIGTHFALTVLAESAPDEYAREIAYKVASILGVAGRSLQTAIEEIDDFPMFHKRIIATLSGLPDSTLVWRTLSEMMVARSRFVKIQWMLVGRGVFPFLLFFIGAQILLTYLHHFFTVANIKIKGFPAYILHGIGIMTQWQAYAVYAVIVAAIIAIVWIVRTVPVARIAWEKILYRLPYIGNLMREYDSGFVARVIGATWATGGGAISLEYAAEIVPRAIVARPLEAIVRELRGKDPYQRTWAEAMSQCDILLPQVRRTIALALTSENIPKELVIIGESMMNTSMAKIEALLTEINAAMPAILMGALDILIMGISFGLMQGFSMTPYQR